MEHLEKLRAATKSISGMSDQDFDLAKNLWLPRSYKKGEFYNQYHNVCKYLGFIISGVFRIYRFDERSATERNMLFFTSEQFMTPYKSFFSQLSCEYYTESMTKSDIMYIHYDHLQHLYQSSPAWERFGRIYAESALNTVMSNTEGFLFKSAEERYKELLEQHPDIFEAVPLYHIASHLGIEPPSLSRIRKRLKQE